MAKTYADAGVNIKQIRKMQAGINSALAKTANQYTPDFIAGHYAGFFEVNGNKMTVHTDGVGSKILVAQELGIHNTVGIDAVAMNANDLICVGSKPIVGVDYLALSKTDEKLVNEIMKGLVEGCKQSHMALVGGETAILPDMIKSDKKRETDYDLAFTAVGINEHKPITGKDMGKGDLLIGLASSGLHSNGFSLARKVLSFKDWGEDMLIPTQMYVDSVLEMLKETKVNGIAHITGGAFSKLARIGEHANLGFELNNMPKNEGIFAELEKKVGDIKEAYRTFNMGVGMVIVAPKENAQNIIRIAGQHKINAMQIGEVVAGNDVILKKDGKKLSLI